MPFKSKINWKEQLPIFYQMGKEGHSLAAIARHYGISRQRAKQLAQRHFPSWDNECSRAARVEQQRRILQRKWGTKEDTDLYRSKRLKWRSKKYYAVTKGIDFTLEFGDVDWPTHCPMLGMELDYFAEGTQENSPSFDRIDSNKGYTKENTHIISWRANRIKNNSSLDDLKKITSYMNSLTCQDKS